MLLALYDVTILIIFVNVYTFYDVDVKNGMDVKLDLPKYYDYCRCIVKKVY